MRKLQQQLDRTYAEASPERRPPNRITEVEFFILPFSIEYVEGTIRFADGREFYVLLD